MLGGHIGGWTTIIKLDISKGNPCPSGWIKITTPGTSPKVVCRSDGHSGDDFNFTIFSYHAHIMLHSARFAAK